MVLATVPRHGDWTLDLGAYLNAAHRLIDGRPLYLAETTSGPFRPGPPGLYLYAPPFAAMMLPLASVASTLAATIWLVVHELMLLGSCALMPVRPPSGSP